MDKRYASRRNLRQRSVYESLDRVESDITRSLVPAQVLIQRNKEYIQKEFTIKWDDLPEGVDVISGELHDKPSRVQKKRLQLQSMINIINQEIQKIEERNIEQKEITIIEFGCGSGHLGILLAYLYPKYTIILNECKEYSIQNCKERIATAMLTNIEIYNCDVRSLPPFQLIDNNSNSLFIGVGLHTCGLLCDIILKLMKEHEYPFVIVPCCYGQLGRLPPAYSQLDYEEYCILSKYVDDRNDILVVTSGADICTDTHISKRCMNAIDYYRLHFMHNSKFLGILTELEPLDSTPKNQVLIGQWNDR